MDQLDLILKMRDEIRRELTEHIIPFWMSLRDPVRGGFTGLVEFDLSRHPEADRGCILNSRILWFFSECALYFHDRKLSEAADAAYAELGRMTDDEMGGVYWMIRPDGTPSDPSKHTYNQAFAVYALSAYYRASGNPEALERAKDLFGVIENRCRDRDGYLEAFTRDFKPASNEKLSENGVMASRTMNTLLHVLEGYTGLYQAWPDPSVKERLCEILEIFRTKIYNYEKQRQEVFFDREYHTLIDLHSYGHDIETSWLADRTLELLDDPELTGKIRPLLLEMAEKTFDDALTDHGFVNECEKGKVDTKRIWWIQSEAIVGFLNAWEKTGNSRYPDAVLSIWDYTKSAIIDPRPGSEWFWYVKEDGTPAEDPMVEPCKCPYHNGRMALEVLRRLEKYDRTAQNPPVQS